MEVILVAVVWNDWHIELVSNYGDKCDHHDARNGDMISKAAVNWEVTTLIMPYVSSHWSIRAQGVPLTGKLEWLDSEDRAG